MQALKIVLFSIYAAILFGVLHDQVTARVCVDYFTIGHADVFHTTSPTLLAFGWGVLATWWVGLMLGLPLAVFARAGSPPKLAWTHLVRPVAILLGCAGAASLLCGIAGFVAARAGWIQLYDPYLAGAAPEEKHVSFLADLCAHNAAYAVGFFGGPVVWAGTWARRRALQRAGKTAAPVLP